MNLVLLLLESELPRASCITPSQVSTLEPFAGNFAGDPHLGLVPSKPHFPKFPHLGSCAWSMNQMVHVFSKIMSWFQVVLEAFMAWLWLPLVLDRMGWRRKGRQLAEAFPTLYYVIPALCHMRNDGNELSKEGFNPCWTRVLFWFDWSSWNWWWWAPCTEIWLDNSRELQLLRFSCELGWLSWAL